MSANMHDQRLEALELKFMELENTVQQLNEVIVNQYRHIDTLNAQLIKLNSRIDHPEPDAATPTPADELPPHY